MVLAQTAAEVGGWLGGIALLVGALAGAYATIVTATRTGKATAAAAAQPPAPAAGHDDDDEVLTARMWFEMLARGDNLAIENDQLRRDKFELERRLAATESERLELLRRMARGEHP